MRINHKIFSNILFCSLLIMSLCSCFQDESVDQMQNRLKKQYDLIIRAGEPSSFYVPPYTKADATIPDGGTANAASPLVLKESLKGVEKALKSYPEGFVSSLIDAIFISGELWFEGERAGGTYSNSWIIVASSLDNGGKESNYEVALYGVHHELSSFVLNKSIFTTLAWRELMPEGWEVTQSYSKALSTTEYGTPPDLENGFLNKYAETSVENDFNTYAEFAFIKPEQLIQMAEKYPLVAKKLRLFIDAYKAVSPEIATTLAPFEKVAADDWEYRVKVDMSGISINPTIN